MSTVQGRKGFTIVELVIVIIVIAVLATIGVIAYRGAADDALKATLKSDLNQVAAKLETIRQGQNSLPEDGSELKVSEGTDLQYSKYSSSSFCVTAQGERGMSFYLDSESKVVKEGKCGDHDEPEHRLPLDPNNKSQWKSVTSGLGYSCAISPDDKAYCWGANTYGRLGNNSTIDSPTPTPVYAGGVLSGKSIKSINAGDNHTCVIADDGRAYCWGYNLYGQLGNNYNNNSPIPVAVQTSGGVLAGKTFKQIGVGGDFTCAVASDDKAYCWGYNDRGQLGDDSGNNSRVPVPVQTNLVLSGKTVKQLASGRFHACVIASDDKAYCWGSNMDGQLGSGYSTISSPVPVMVQGSIVLGGKSIRSMDAGFEHTCVVDSDGKAYCWGSGSAGQLGNSPAVSTRSPVAVYSNGGLAGKKVKQLQSGGFHNCATTTDAQTYCWGSNQYGQLGSSPISNAAVLPTSVQPGSTLAGRAIKQVAPGASHTCALVAGGQIYCWGYNYDGRLGSGPTNGSPTLMLISTRP